MSSTQINGDKAVDAPPGHKPRHPQAMDEHDMPKDLRRPRAVVIIAAGVAFAALLGGMFAIGWFPNERMKEQTKGDAARAFDAVPIVTIAPPRLAKAAIDVRLPCDIRPNMETAIYARTNGYLSSFKHDIGEVVKEGDLLATIATPEVDAQLAQMQAALEQAQANLQKSQTDFDYAKRTLERYQETQRTTGTVGVQELDDKQAAFDQASATLAQAKASIDVANTDIQRLKTLQGFETVMAPFSGIVTERNYDEGALISPGNAGGARPMFRLAQINTVRVFVNVPQLYASDIKVGQDAFLGVRNYAGVEFKGRVSRSSHAVDTATRTILFELAFDNADRRLYPGMYGTATLHVTQEQTSLVIDTSALIFDAKGSQVALVKDGAIHFQPITVGRDLGTELEITEGLSAKDQVVINPGQRLAEGIQVDARAREAAPKIEQRAQAQ